ncbi:MAG: maleylpyruvate isomerase family mycothiol-dependent enzyme, partial [Acidimicrobiia bacterium]
AGRGDREGVRTRGQTAHRLPPLRVVTGPRVWLPDGVYAVETLTADPFELGRALTGRRSADQIRALGWSTRPEPYLAAFTSLGPFTTRPTDLVE